MNPIQQLLMILQLVAAGINAAAPGTPVGEGADAAGYLIKIAQAANAAYLAQTGKPIDPALLHQEAPLPDPPAPPTTPTPPTGPVAA